MFNIHSVPINFVVVLPLVIRCNIYILTSDLIILRYYIDYKNEYFYVWTEQVSPMTLFLVFDLPNVCF